MTAVPTKTTSRITVPPSRPDTKTSEFIDVVKTDLKMRNKQETT